MFRCLLVFGRFVGVVAALVVSASLSGTSAETTSKVIRIAVDLPFSGASSDTVNSEARAFDLAIALAQAHGLPGGYRLQTVPFDHGAPGKIFDPDLAVQNADANAADPLILAVFGPQSSGAAKKMIPLLNAADLAMVSATNTNPTLTEAIMRPTHPEEITYFRLCGTDDLQGAAGAQLAEQLGYKKVFVLDNGDTFGHGLAESFANSFGKVANVVEYDRNVTPAMYPDVIGKIMTTHPDAVYFGADAVELGAFRRQMSDTGIGLMPFLSGDGMNLDGYIERAGKATFHSFYTVMSPNGLHLDNAIARRFTRDFYRRYSRAPQPFDAAAFSSGQVIGAAIRSALEQSHGRLPTRKEVAAAIARTHGLQTALGPVTFNADGNIRTPYVSYYTFNLESKLVFLRQITVQTVSY